MDYKISITTIFFIVYFCIFGLCQLENKDKQVQGLLADDSTPEVRKDFPFYLSGYAKDGRPLWVSEYAKYPLRKYAERGDVAMKQVLKHIDQMCIKMKESADAVSTPDRPISQFHLLSDVDNFQMSTILHLPTAQFVIKQAVVFASHVRTDAKTITVINANQAFELLFAVIKPALGSVAEIFDMNGTNQNKWKPKIHKLYGKESLQKWYGGTAEKAVAAYG